MLNKANLSFLAAVTASAEEAARWGAAPDHAALSLPLNPRARADQLLRMRLMQARERGSRWRQKHKPKAPKKVRSPSADLHKAYRQPMPPPPPNSPRYSLLGLPAPLLGVPYINPRALLSPSPPSTACTDAARGDAAEEKDFDSDGFRDLDSCAGDADSGGRRAARSPRKALRAASRRGQESAAAAAENKDAFFDIFYGAVKQEAKIREEISRDDFGSGTTATVASPKKRVRFRETASIIPDEPDDFAYDNLQSSLESFRVLSPNPIFMTKSSDRNADKFEISKSQTLNLQNSQNEFHSEVEKLHGLPPLVFKKDKVITNSLRSTSIHEPFTRSLENRGNYLRVKQSTYQKPDQKNKNKTINHPSFFAKRHEVGTEKMIKELTQEGIHFSTLFDMRKIKGSKTPNVYSHSDVNTTRSSRPPVTIDSILYDACQIGNAIRMKENTTEENHEFSSSSAAHRLYLSAKSSIERSRKNVGAKIEHKEEVQESRKSIYRPKVSSETNPDTCAKGIYKDTNYTSTGLNEVVKNNSTVNIENEIARNRALSREIDESLARACLQRVSSPNKSTGASDVPEPISFQENALQNSKTCALSSENSIANKKIGNIKPKIQKSTDQDAVFGLIKQMVKLKRARNLT